jgi:site-specific DNA recombinase
MKKNYDFNKYAKVPKSIVTKRNKNSVMYTRVSSQEQEENFNSLTTQAEKIRYEAERLGYVIIEHFGASFESAKSDERKEFQRMLKFVRNPKNNISNILVYSADRFSRTGSNAIGLTDVLRKKNGVHVVCTSQPADTNTATGTFQQNMQFLFSKYDNDLRTQRTIDGSIGRLRRGDWCGKAPEGYDNVTIHKKKLVLVNEKSKFIKKAFSLKYDERLDNVKIVERLAAIGFKTNLKRLNAIFRNPFYCGLMAHTLLAGEVIKGNHEPLISEEVFIKVNELLDLKAFGYHVVENDNLPMKNFVKCSCCNNPMTGYINRKKKIHYYKCNTRGCSNNINAKYCHQQFTMLLNSFSISTNLIPALREQLMLTYNMINEKNSSEESQLKKRLTEVQNNLMTVRKRYGLGLIDLETRDACFADLNLESAEVTAQLKKVESKLSNLEKFIDKSISISQNLNKIWENSDYTSKQKLQYLVFPDGMQFDKQKRCYLTSRVNAVFTYILRISGDTSGSLNDKRSVNTPLSSWVPRAGVEPACQ